MADLPFRDHRSCLVLWQTLLDMLADGGTAVGTRVRVPRGAALWLPGDLKERMYALVRGRVNIVTTDPSGREVVVQVVGAGEPFGELCFCVEDGPLRNNTALAVVDSEVVETPYAAVLAHLQARGDLLDTILASFCRRLSDCELRSEALTHRRADHRLGRILLMLATRPHQPLRTAADLAVTHRELALLAAVTRAHATVVLNRLKEKRVVSYQRSGPISVDIAKLEAFLGRSGTPAKPRARRSAKR